MRGQIPFAWVADASRRAYHTPTFAGAGDFLRRYASVYRADLWEGFSDTYVEVWAESRSLASVLETDCKELAVSLYPSGGFSSHSFISILRTVFGCRRFFEINKLDEARCFIFNLGLHPEFDKKTGRSINLCFIET